eukprot:2724245-Alexandrium_andersonii.AAC.1
MPAPPPWDVVYDVWATVPELAVVGNQPATHARSVISTPPLCGHLVEVGGTKGQRRSKRSSGLVPQGTFNATVAYHSLPSLDGR